MRKLSMTRTGRHILNAECWVRKIHLSAEKAWNDNWEKQVYTNDLHLVWDVPYEPGELRAEGYRNGEVAAIAVVKTTKEAVTLAAEVDRKTLQKHQIAQIELSVEDEDGNLQDLSLYSNPQRKMYAGRLLVVICADAPGSVEVAFSSPGIQGIKVFLQVEASD